jgi:hypothetical protein
MYAYTRRSDLNCHHTAPLPTVSNCLALLNSTISHLTVSLSVAITQGGSFHCARPPQKTPPSHDVFHVDFDKFDSCLCSGNGLRALAVACNRFRAQTDAVEHFAELSMKICKKLVRERVGDGDGTVWHFSKHLCSTLQDQVELEFEQQVRLV